MAYQQVRDILKHVQSLRQRVQELARQQQADTQNEMLADFLARLEQHDEYMEACLAGRVEDLPEGVLETWIQFPDTQSLDAEIRELSENADGADGEASLSDDDQAVQQVLALDQRILDLYKNAARQVQSSRVQSLFDDLVLMEDQKARAKGWGYMENRDLDDDL